MGSLASQQRESLPYGAYDDWAVMAWKTRPQSRGLSLIMKIAFVLLVVASCTVRLSVGDSTMDMINKGIEAGNKIAQLLADQKIEDFGASLGKIAGKVSKYLEAFAPVLGLFQLLLPDDKYNEIEEGFARMDAKFDQVFNRIDDLGDEQQKISLKTQFGAYERKITLFSKRLDDYLKSVGKSENIFLETYENKTLDDYLKSVGKSENIFLETYENKTFDENVMQLYMAMMKTHSGPLSDSIPDLVRDFTNENRKDTEMVMKRILHLIIQGAAIEMAYYSLTGDKERYNTTKHDWEERISKLIEHIREIDEDMRFNYMGQVEKDTSVLLAKMYGRSNRDFADALYKFLSQKYEWREWVVVVFNDVPDNIIKLAKNSFQITLHGKHVIVASSAKDRKADISHTRYMLSKIPSGYYLYPTMNMFSELRWRNYDVTDLYNRIPRSLLSFGSEYTVGVVTKDESDLVVRGPDDRYAIVSKGRDRPWPFPVVKSWIFALFTDKEIRPDPKGDAIEAQEGEKDD
ncbi:uncharacterized protein LOC133180692 [Saccostrea echinata]|uniref:uncharacterized protein LOC133180692 n=1 Tax=Saccostrea echinata TaxID=191078 RepID=UPI002A7EA88B|nr:uncharacterized protein LOC133180692 [Saccostrea echinata]